MSSEQSNQLVTSKKREQDLVIKLLENKNFTGTWLAATGCGKTKLGCDLCDVIVKKYNNPSILIIVPTTNLRDNEWVNELDKWGYTSYAQYIKIECIQTVYKWKKKQFDLVICDEVHTQLSDNYKLFFENNTFKHILGLSATIEDDGKKDLINKYMPIVHTTSVQRALDLNLIVPFKVFNVALSLTNEENKKLRRINYLYGQAERDLGGPFEAFDNANKYRNKENAPNLTVYKAAQMFWMQMQNRKKLLMQSSNKIKATKYIVDKFKDKKILIFCDNIEMLEKIEKVVKNSTVYHSKLKKDENIENLKSFSENHNPNVLISVKALSAGLDIPKCEIGICVGGSSKRLEDTQRRGGIVRLDSSNPDKIGYYFNLYIKGTQEEKWLTKRLTDVNSNYIKNINFINKF